MNVSNRMNVTVAVVSSEHGFKQALILYQKT